MQKLDILKYQTQIKMITHQIKSEKKSMFENSGRKKKENSGRNWKLQTKKADLKKNKVEIPEIKIQ